MRERSPIVDRLGSAKLALLDRNTLRGGNAKRPLLPPVTPFGGGLGEAGRPPDRGVWGVFPPRFGLPNPRI